MSYVPGFENDLFISYTHIDNASLTKDKDGWVTFFHNVLLNRLRQLLGAELDIWRDAKLQGNDLFSDTLVKKFPQIATLIAILSPRYVQSEWCLRELQEFAQVAEQTGGLLLEDKARIFKVVKTSIPREEHPSALKGLLGYEFFEINPQTGRPNEFRPELGAGAEQKFFAKLEDLAYDIHLLLKMLRGRGAGAPAPVANGAAVYLAETTSDQREAYDKIRRELQERGCMVLPDVDLPITNAAELRRKIQQALQKSKLSIHLIGQNYGVVPEGETCSLVEIQHELAAALAPAFTRLIWLPPALQTMDDRQQHWLEALRRGEYVQDGADLLETPLEDLRAAILHKLRNGKQNGISLSPRSGPARVYLICDQADLPAAQALDDYFYDQGFEVELPAFEGDETRLRETHQEKLQLCDAALIFCGGATDAWLSSKKADLQKAYGWGRQQPFKAQAVYLAGPEASFKQRFRSREVMVMKNFATFSPDDLRDFVAALK